MEKKFITCKDDISKTELLNNGFTMIYENKDDCIFIFENKIPDNYDIQDLPCYCYYSDDFFC